MAQAGHLDDPEIGDTGVASRDAEHLGRDPMPRQLFEQRRDRPEVVRLSQTAGQEQDRARGVVHKITSPREGLEW
jgi:hypothetical protein